MIGAERLIEVTSMGRVAKVNSRRLRDWRVKKTFGVVFREKAC